MQENQDKSEKQIETFLMREVKKLGGRSYKFVSPGQSGVPDRIVFLPGRKLYFVELKQKTGMQSSLQKLQKKRLEELGQEVYTLYGMEDVNEFLKHVSRHD